MCLQSKKVTATDGLLSLLHLADAPTSPSDKSGPRLPCFTEEVTSLHSLSHPHVLNLPPVLETKMSKEEMQEWRGGPVLEKTLASLAEDRVRFPASTQRLITACNSSAGGSDTLLDRQGHQAWAWCT